MRLVRLGQQRAQVTNDITATLTSLRRTNTALEGVALLGVEPPGAREPLDAVLVLPGGVVTVVGVDLPDPAMRLEAPLREQWKADGWPLVHAEDAVNPATEALAVSETVLGPLRSVQPDLTVGTVVALGPFVETVDQPPTDLMSAVRVLHPRPTSMLAALVSLACAREPLTLEQARRLVAELAPSALEVVDAALLAEGFAPSVGVDKELLTATTATIPAVHPGPGSPFELPRAAPAPAFIPTAIPPTAAPRGVGTHGPAQPDHTRADPRPGTTNPRRRARWLPPTALVLLALLVGTIALAIGNRGGSETATVVQPPSEGTGPVARQLVDGVSFTERATASDSGCVAHSFGDLTLSLQRTDCVRLLRGSFDADVGGSHAAVTLAIIRFSNPEQAAAFQIAADTPGGGAMTDPASETGRWPGTPPRFDHAVYRSSKAGSEVRLVLAGDFPRVPTSGDPRLARIAEAALDLLLPN